MSAAELYAVCPAAGFAAFRPSAVLGWLKAEFAYRLVPGFVIVPMAPLKVSYPSSSVSRSGYPFTSSRGMEPSAKCGRSARTPIGRSRLPFGARGLMLLLGLVSASSGCASIEWIPFDFPRAETLAREIT